MLRAGHLIENHHFSMDFPAISIVYQHDIY